MKVRTGSGPLVSQAGRVLDENPIDETLGRGGVRPEELKASEAFYTRGALRTRRCGVRQARRSGRARSALGVTGSHPRS